MRENGDHKNSEYRQLLRGHRLNYFFTSRWKAEQGE